MKTVIVVGAGAAGLMAAGTAAGAGARVILIEKNKVPGKKLLITGKGRCNITNEADLPDFIKNFPGNGQFLFSALNNFSNWDLISFFAENGLETKLERGGRFFPVSDRAGDVVEVLENYCRDKGVEFRYSLEAVRLLVEGGKVKGLQLSEGKELEGDAVIIATGGASYPGTGSTGDGYKIAAQVNHRIVPPRPSLVPLETGEGWVKELQGLTLKNVRAKLLADGKAIGEDFGELLFTHFGLSGPIILTLSRGVQECLDRGKKVKVVIDLKPALSEEQLDNRVLRDFDEVKRKQFKNSLGDLLPKSLIPVIIRLSGIPEEKPVHQVSKGERLRLVQLIKALPLTVTAVRPLREAIVTAGGVSTKEINPKTMESKLVKGLYFAGEVIDIDGLTGGFNLQAAFSTGFVAGQRAAR